MWDSKQIWITIAERTFQLQSVAFSVRTWCCCRSSRWLFHSLFGKLSLTSCESAQGELTAWWHEFEVLERRHLRQTDLWRISYMFPPYPLTLWSDDHHHFSHWKTASFELPTTAVFEILLQSPLNNCVEKGVFFVPDAIPFSWLFCPQTALSFPWRLSNSFVNAGHVRLISLTEQGSQRNTDSLLHYLPS